jgi:uncharacterized protein (TIGR03067 family)
MNRKLWLVSAVVVLVAADGTLNDASRKDLDKMQGAWAAVSYVKDGFTLPDDDAQALFRSVHGQEYAISRYDKVIGKGTFALDGSKTPKTIDAMPATAQGKGKPILGIYEFEGERFKTCFAAPGKDRPKEFSSPEGSGNTLVTWEREKKPGT